MFKYVRHALIIAGLFASLWFVNSQIRAMNTLKNEGADVSLKLRPVDPRALMQGDFMALAYSEDSLPERDREAATSGAAILELNVQGIGVFKRLDEGTALSRTEIKLNFARDFRGNASYGGERYFFQEGTAQIYEEAEYGLFKVGPDGRAMLVGLADEDLKPIKPAPNP